MNNHLVERHDEIADLLDRGEQAFAELKRIFAKPTNTEGLERDMRFAVGHVEVAMELIYEALTEESVATTQPDR